MNVSPVVEARKKAGRLILLSNAWLLGGAIVLYLFLVIQTLIFRPGYQPNWIYLICIGGLFGGALFSLSRLNSSLSQGMILYAIIGMVCVAVMILYAFFIDHEKTTLMIFALHMGIVALGVVLGFRAALGYATVTTLFLIFLGFLYQDRSVTVTAGILAYCMTFPSWLVDRLEYDLRKSEEKFSSMFREALDVILVVEIDTGAILRANHAVSSILGYPEDELLGKPYSGLLPPESRLSGYNMMESLRTRRAVFESEFFLRIDGQLCPMDLTAKLIPWGEGDAALVTLRDVTERHYAEEQLRRHQEQLELLVRERTSELQQTNVQLRLEVVERQRAEEALRQQAEELEARNAELDAFAHTVAHDLKNPLTNLIGFSSLLEKRYDHLSTDRLLYYAQSIAQNGRKMNNIINELLLLASVRKIEEVERQLLDMSEIVQEALGRLRDMIVESQAVIVTPDSWPAAYGYAPWVEEIWANYISNAIKYGGLPPQVALGATVQADGMLRFWVRDNGKGLTPDECSQLFTLFTRLDKVRARGHGLGLSIVRRIVEKLGGQVQVESEVGHGSVFSFTLPAAHVAAVEFAPLTPSTPESTGPGTP